MQFNSYTFLLFFSLVLGLHYLPLPWRLKKLNLILASTVFYAAWNPPFVILIWISTLVDWQAARGIRRARSPIGKRLFVLLSLATNLGLLAYFKYGTFAVQTFLDLLQAMGAEIQLAPPSIILPIGISFYTFQTLSYTIDVYRGDLDPADSFLDYALYVTFFPQLVAGPIVRAREFLPQCRSQTPFRAQLMGWGLTLLILGLFEKVVLADRLLAPVAELVFDSSLPPSVGAAWIGTLAFSGQIFFDFAGYSTCAIGVGLCLGFALPDNFRFPYAAIGFSDFWRRWHISLSTWLRDYLYISLGGNRGGALRTYRNLALTMLLGGLWHGASWTFVAWGAIHGFYLTIERVFRKTVASRDLAWGWAARVGGVLVTYVLVCYAWVFFRAPTFGKAFDTVLAMSGVSASGPLQLAGKTPFAIVAVLTVALLGVHSYLRDRSVEEVFGRFHWTMRAAVIAGMLAAIVTMSGDDRSFIYFQF